ncbi:hypothetical protein DN730_16050 [Marinomonas piezotolerans]|uniref:Uncharacterized protein n=1 Tax=Marinomonas piezotolerans TaxID=2213058 RepID=A0A370U5H1_9GAMM|nr:hypothetical protein [Marinomonas piezotolerans]RDL43017.1 hypothetical protein DN730_16050 [Marinomonas piezotolerans]
MQRTGLSIRNMDQPKFLPQSNLCIRSTPNIGSEQLSVPQVLARTYPKKLLTRNIVISMDFKQPVVVIPNQEVSRMIVAVRTPFYLTYK